MHEHVLSRKYKLITSTMCHTIFTHYITYSYKLGWCRLVFPTHLTTIRWTMNPVTYCAATNIELLSFVVLYNQMGIQIFKFRKLFWNRCTLFFKEKNRNFRIKSFLFENSLVLILAEWANFEYSNFSSTWFLNNIFWRMFFNDTLPSMLHSSTAVLHRKCYKGLFAAQRILVSVSIYVLWRPYSLCSPHFRRNFFRSFELTNDMYFLVTSPSTATTTRNWYHQQDTMTSQ